MCKHMSEHMSEHMSKHLLAPEGRELLSRLEERKQSLRHMPKDERSMLVREAEDLAAVEYEDEAKALKYEDEAKAPKYEDEAKAPKYEDEVKAPKYEDEAKAPMYEDEAKAAAGAAEKDGDVEEAEGDKKKRLVQAGYDRIARRRASRTSQDADEATFAADGGGAAARADELVASSSADPSSPKIKQRSEPALTEERDAARLGSSGGVVAAWVLVGADKRIAGGLYGGLQQGIRRARGCGRCES